METRPSFPLCLHIKTNGVRCQSPALRGRDWCFFHAKLHGCHRAVRRLPAGSPPVHLRDLPALEDRESIQLSISAVFASLAAGQIDSRQAYALFSGLQLAAANVQHCVIDPYNNGKAVMLGYDSTRDGLELAGPSRGPEPEPAADLAHVPAPAPAVVPAAPSPAVSKEVPPESDLCETDRPDAPGLFHVAPDRAAAAPCRSPLAPRPLPDRDAVEERLIRLSVSDRLKARAPYNFKDDVLARK